MCTKKPKNYIHLYIVIDLNIWNFDFVVQNIRISQLLNIRVIKLIYFNKHIPNINHLLCYNHNRSHRGHQTPGFASQKQKKAAQYAKKHGHSYTGWRHHGYLTKEMGLEQEGQMDPLPHSRNCPIGKQDTRRDEFSSDPGAQRQLVFRRGPQEVWETEELGVLILRGPSRWRSTHHLCMRRMAL